MAIIIFNSTNHALAAEKALETDGIEIDIVPLPKEFSAECGLAIEFDIAVRPAVEAVLENRRIEYKGIYEI